MSEKIKMEIERDLLLKLKSTNYEAYQLLNSLKLVEDLDYDYCQTLDIEKLKRECELGYFNVMDLFPKEKIISAYLEYVNPVSRMVKFSDLIEDDRHLIDGGKSVSIGYKIDEAKRGGVGLEQGAKPIITVCDQASHGTDYNGFADQLIEKFQRGASDFVQTNYVKLENIIPDKEIPGAYHIKKESPKKHQALFDWINKNPFGSIKIKYDDRSFLEIQSAFISRGIGWCASGLELIKPEEFCDIVYDAENCDIGFCFSGRHNYDSITEKFI